MLMAKVPKKNKETPKYTPYDKLQLHLPKSAFLYKLKRVYWLINNYHKLLDTNPAALPFKQYKEALDEYTAMVEEAQKLGLHTREGRLSVKSRVGSEKLAENGNADATPALGDSLPPGMGAGV